MALVHKIEDHLLIPFGGQTASPGNLAVVGLSATGVFFESERPLASIRRSDCKGLRLRDFQSLIPGAWPELTEDAQALRFIESQLISRCDADASHEQWFIEVYLKFCRAAVAAPRSLAAIPLKDRPVPYNSSRWIFDALMPLPQAHLFGAPSNSGAAVLQKVGFAFWTGRRLIALEIDDVKRSTETSRADKAERLEGAGIHVIHLNLDDLDEVRARAAIALFPDEITHFWKFSEAQHRRNPFYASSTS